MSAEIVKKIDKKFLDNGTREEFRVAIYELLDLCGTIPPLKQRIQLLENEILRLKGEKKSPSSGWLIERRPRYERG